MPKLKEKQNLNFNVETKALADGELEVIVNSGQADRVNEILDIKGLDISDYQKNPVVLFAHDYSQPAIGKATKIWKTSDGMLKAVVKFATEEYDFAKTIYKLMKNGYMQAFSIGFIPYDGIEDKDGTFRFTASSMLEFSAVPVPADPRALITATKELGGNGKDLIKVLDGKMKMADYKEKEEKGAVADELTAEQTYEEKAKNMRQIWDIMYAFCDVYFDEKTDMNDFDTLLTETIGLMQNIVDGTENPAKALNVQSIDKAQLAQFLIEKEGKVLSKKNRSVVESAVAALTELLNADNTDTTKDATENKDLDGLENTINMAKRAIEAVEKKSQTSNGDDLQKARSAAVILDKIAELAIKQLSDAMKGKE